MTTGKMSRKPSDTHRSTLMHRATKMLAQAGKPIHRLTDAEKKSPSQKKSENARKRDLQRAEKQHPATAQENQVLYDCFTCPKHPCYGNSLRTCGEPTLTRQCKQCGQKIIYRIDPNKKWEYCLVCRSMRKEV
jgi:hypothetical protein